MSFTKADKEFLAKELSRIASVADFQRFEQKIQKITRDIVRLNRKVQSVLEDMRKSS
jgi:hypothetical protein